MILFTGQFSMCKKHIFTCHEFHSVSEDRQQWLSFWLWRTRLFLAAHGQTVKDASERDCVALTGTQRIETCVKGWGIEFYFLTAEWPFASQGATRQMDFAVVCLFSTAAPSTGLRINAPHSLSAEQGELRPVVSMSTSGNRSLQPKLLMRMWTINVSFCKLA